MDSDLTFDAINEFSVQWKWIVSHYEGPMQMIPSHVHNTCEIYVHVSGNASFMVENHIYPLTRGDIIITAPNEYHHCILLNQCVHEHFWILIPVNSNEHLLSCFLNRKYGTGNLISLPGEKREIFLSLCYYMNKCKQQSNKLEQYATLLQILTILNNGYQEGSIPLDSCSPKELKTALDYINENYKTIKTIHEVTNALYISQSTLNRIFRKYLGIRPYAYIEDKRFAHAEKMLLSGKSVSNACYESGFSDCSHFILMFRRKYGITPLQYKKMNQQCFKQGSLPA